MENITVVLNKFYIVKMNGATMAGVCSALMKAGAKKLITYFNIGFLGYEITKVTQNEQVTQASVIKFMNEQYEPKSNSISVHLLICLIFTIILCTIIIVAVLIKYCKSTKKSGKQCKIAAQFDA